MTETEQPATAASPEAAALWNQLWTNECAYWAEVDLNNGLGASEFYTEDAIFDVGLPDARLESRDAIARFYALRAEGPPRTTLHIVNNFALVDWSASSARTRSIVSLYGGEGSAPKQSDKPVLMTFGETSYVATAGAWKINSRLNCPLFVDSEHLSLDRIKQAADHR